MSFNNSQIEVLNKLSSEYKKINPFATLLDRNIIEKKCEEIFLSSNNLGYMLIKENKEYIRIIDIFSSTDSLEVYSELLNKLSKKATKYVGVYKKGGLEKALRLNGFNLRKEHHQMIKVLNNESKQDIELKELSEIESEKILKFLNLYAPQADYTLEEVAKKKYRKYSFYIYDEELIGIIIAFRDPLRENGLYLEQIVIKKSQQGKGYGKRAFKQFLFLAQKQKQIHIRLHVYKDNKVAYNLYKNQGFRKDKIIAYWENEYGTRRF
ncbi:MAG: GNAT family N-acetyltransferase [Clostridia bacterium]